MAGLYILFSCSGISLILFPPILVCLSKKDSAPKGKSLLGSPCTMRLLLNEAESNRPLSPRRGRTFKCLPVRQKIREKGNSLAGAGIVVSKARCRPCLEVPGYADLFLSRELHHSEVDRLVGNLPGRSLSVVTITNTICHTFSLSLP